MAVRYPAGARGARFRAASQAAAPAQANAAEREQRIVLYGKADCPACRRVRRWFKVRRIGYHEVDVGESTRAAAELQERRKKIGVRHNLLPAVEVNGVLLESVSPKALRAALDKAN